MRKSKTYSYCSEWCERLSLSQKDICSRTCLLLQIYRTAFNTANIKAWDCVFEAQIYGEKNLSQALEYLTEFAPEIEREKFRHRINSLFQTSWLLEIVGCAMEILKTYPHNGQLYYDILNMAYITPKVYSEPQILSRLSISRSTFYQKKKDAIFLLAIILWVNVIPKKAEKNVVPTSEIAV